MPRSPHHTGWIAVGIALISLAAVFPAYAQEALTVPPGTRIRIQTEGQPDEWVVGTYLGREGDAVRLDVGAVPLAPVPASTITRVEVNTGRRSNTGKGALAGAAAGAVFGLVAGITCEYECYALATIGVFAGLGAGIGALAGSLVRSDRWEVAAVSSLSQESWRPPVQLAESVLLP